MLSLKMQRELAEEQEQEMEKLHELQRDSALALQRQAELQREAGETRAVAARIEVYNQQIAGEWALVKARHLGSVPDSDPNKQNAQRMEKERERLTARLDAILERMSSPGS